MGVELVLQLVDKDEVLSKDDVKQGIELVCAWLYDHSVDNPLAPAALGEIIATWQKASLVPEDFLKCDAVTNLPGRLKENWKKVQPKRNKLWGVSFAFCV